MSLNASSFVADNKGHLLPGIEKSDRSPFGEFIGTWDLPKRIPGPYHVHPMGRTEKNFGSLCSQRDRTNLEMEQARSYKVRAAVDAYVDHRLDVRLFLEGRLDGLPKLVKTTMCQPNKRDFIFTFLSCSNALTGLNLRSIHMLVELGRFL